MLRGLYECKSHEDNQQLGNYFSNYFYNFYLIFIISMEHC